MLAWAHSQVRINLLIRPDVQAAREVAQRCPGVTVSVFSDRDLEPQRAKIEAELGQADVFFASLLFDYDQV